MRACVAVVRCDSYEQGAVERAIARGFDLLGGPARFFGPGESVLIKPNMLLAARPEAAVCVHPAVFRGIALVLRRAGYRLGYGDSPAVVSPENAAHASGIASIAEELSIPMANFRDEIEVSSPAGCTVRKFNVARAVKDYDSILSVSKMKTHSFTGLTGAVKNLLGFVPGFKKAGFHARFPDPDAFCRILVELALTLNPRLHIMDGIVAMEGNGPGSGNPRRVNVLLFSNDPVALDAVATLITGFDPSRYPILHHGKQLGLGNPDYPEFLGDDIDEFKISDFSFPELHFFRDTSLPVRLFRHLILPYPVADPGKCTRCGQCCAVCPVNPKAMSFRRRGGHPAVKNTLCIRCFCCQEVCPEHAISIVHPIAGRILQLYSRFKHRPHRSLM